MKTFNHITASNKLKKGLYVRMYFPTGCAAIFKLRKDGLWWKISVCHNLRVFSSWHKYSDDLKLFRKLFYNWEFTLRGVNGKVKK